MSRDAGGFPINLPLYIFAGIRSPAHCKLGGRVQLFIFFLFFIIIILHVNSMLTLFYHRLSLEFFFFPRSDCETESIVSEIFAALLHGTQERNGKNKRTQKTLDFYTFYRFISY